MSQQNVDLVRRVYGLWKKREWSAIPELFDPEVQVDLSRNVFNPGTYRGYSGIEQVLRSTEEMWDDFEIVPTEVLDAGDRVLATVTISGKGRESGVRVNMQVMNVWTIRDSKVVSVTGGYRDRAEALEAAGLSKKDAPADS
jgi:ketosteroid isomerase-like protein